jgi:hypothetical protein
MPNGKSPGLDGFTVDFFKAFLDVVKYDIYGLVEDSRRSASILKSLNSTLINLIPKEYEVRTLDKFRLISLCNLVYKIISKVIANRLKPLLPLLISKEQSGFVEGRQTMDNVIQAHEIIHTLKIRKKSRMIIQLDFSKAYDKLRWHYMEKEMEAFVFEKHWIKWVMALVSTNSFSLLVNGAPTKPFYPSRGLRQGDPLSPFLFIIMMEGLSRTIKVAMEEGTIKGLRVYEEFPTTTHKQSVDDTMLHMIPIVKEATSYKTILVDFGEASGTEINQSKYMIYLFNTNIGVQRNLSNILGFERKNLHTKYLGVPLTDKESKYTTWEEVLTKLHEILKIWTSKPLV